MSQTTTLVVSLLIMMLIGNVAYAQAIADAGTLLQQQQNLDRLPQTPLDTPLLENKPPPTQAPTDQVTVFVHTFLINSDTTAFTDERLLALLEDYINKQLSLSDLQQAAHIITNFYQQHGYFLAQAYLPKQDVTEGIVTITIQEGLLDSNGILINGNNLRLNLSYAKQIISNIIDSDQPLHKKSLSVGFYYLMISLELRSMLI